MAAGINAVSSNLEARLSADAGLIDHAKASETSDELPLHRTDAEGQQKRTDYQNKMTALNQKPNSDTAQYEAALSHAQLQSHICRHYNIDCADPLKTKANCSELLKRALDLMKQTVTKQINKIVIYQISNVDPGFAFAIACALFSLAGILPYA